MPSPAGVLLSSGGAVVLAVMAGAFVAATMAARWPVGLSLAAAAAVGAVVGRVDEPLRQLVEGTLGYLDAILIILFAVLFMTVLSETGALQRLAAWVVRLSGGNAWALLPLSALVVMLPGMITGSSTVAVLTTGALVAPALTSLGLSKVRVAALIAVSSILGMLAPPVNLPAMIIGAGVDLPYVGFEPYLLAATLPLAVLTSWMTGWPLLRSGGRARDVERLAAQLAGGQSLGWRDSVPWAIVAVLLAGPRLAPAYLPDLGHPLIFFVATVAAGLLFRRRLRPVAVAQRAMDLAMPVLGILVGVGMFLQVMTASGARGALVVSVLSLPRAALYGTALVSLPLFGAVSAFGSASVLGVPLLLALLGGNDVAVAAGLSLLAGLGDLVPPTALAGIFAAQVTGIEGYGAVVRACVAPALLVAAAAMFLIGVG